MKASEKRILEEASLIEVPIDGTLDLHHFRPKEITDLVRDYLLECRRKEILLIRLIHGKGIGTLRETVHACLKKIPEVESFSLADESGGSWGATLVQLKK